MIKTHQYLSTGVILSLIIHTIFGITLVQQKVPTAPKVMLVDATIFRELAKRQIVSPPDKVNQQTPETAKHLSDQDNATPIEQIKRGDSTEAGRAIGKNQSALQTNNTQTNTKVETKPVRKNIKNNPGKANQTTKQPNKQPNLKLTETKKTTNSKLDLSTNYDLLKEITSAQKKPANPNNASELSKPFSRAPGSGAMFLGFQGSNDYLPNIQDGDITLLNAKADKFAVFVRRVAIRVFNLLKQYGWEYLTANEFISLNKYTEVKAILNPQGKFIKLIFQGTSGSTNFDRVVEKSVTQGVSDPNPPSSAVASDGNYHFIFKARSWSQISVGTRNGPPGERRWLVLQTGLE